MRCWVSSFLLYFMPNSSTTSVKVVLFLLCLHNPGVMGAGSYPNGCRCFLRSVCAIMASWTRPHIPLSNLT